MEWTIFVWILMSVSGTQQDRNLGSVQDHEDDRYRDLRKRHTFNAVLKKETIESILRDLQPYVPALVTDKRIAEEIQAGSSSGDALLDTMDIDNKIRQYQEFTCPTLELVLLDHFKGFPVIDNMSSNFTIDFDDFNKNISKAVETYEYLKNARLTLLQLLEDISHYMVTTKMVCPATKYEHAIIYVIRQELILQMKQDNGTLFSQMKVILVDANKYDEQFLGSVIKALFVETYGKLITELEIREFPDLTSLLEHLYMKVMEHYLRLGNFPDVNVLTEMLRSTASVHTRVFRCSNMAELMSTQQSLFDYVMRKYTSPDYLSSLVTDVIQDRFKEHFGDIDMDHKLIHSLLEVITRYTSQVFRVMKMYVNRIKTMGELNTVFKDHLDSEQLDALKKIEEMLNADSEQLDALKKIKEMFNADSEQLDALKKIKEMFNAGNGGNDGNPMKKFLMFIVDQLKAFKKDPTSVYIQKLIDDLQTLVNLFNRKAFPVQ